MVMQDFDNFKGAQLGAHLDRVAQEMGFEWEEGYRFARVSNQTLGLPEGGDSDQTNRYVVTDLAVTHRTHPRLYDEDASDNNYSADNLMSDYGRHTSFTLGGDAPSLKVQHETLLGHKLGRNTVVRDRSELSADNQRRLGNTSASVIPTGWSVSSVEPSTHIDRKRDWARQVENPDGDYTPLEWKHREESFAYTWTAQDDTSKTGTVYEQKMPHPSQLDDIQKTGEDLRVSHREEDPDSVDYAAITDSPDEHWSAHVEDQHRGVLSDAKQGMSTKPIVPPGQVRVTLDRYSADQGALSEMWPERQEGDNSPPKFTEGPTARHSLHTVNYSFNNLSEQFERMPD